MLIDRRKSIIRSQPPEANPQSETSTKFEGRSIHSTNLSSSKISTHHPLALNSFHSLFLPPCLRASVRASSSSSSSSSSNANFRVSRAACCGNGLQTRLEIFTQEFIDLLRSAADKRTNLQHRIEVDFREIGIGF